MKPPLLSVESVSKSYGAFREEKQVLDKIDLRLFQGQHLGLIGRSGSGKSTLARLILGLEPPTQGRIYLEGSHLFEYGKNIRKKIQIIFQDPAIYLNPYYSVHQLICEPLKIFVPQLSRKAQHYRVQNLLEQVGLEPRLERRKPHELSGGQCQRVAIARALCLTPILLICDEPFTNIDIGGQARLIALFESLARSHDLSYLFIAHDLALVKRLCPHLAVIQNGRIIEWGKTKAILNRPKEKQTRDLVENSLGWPDRLERKTENKTFSFVHPYTPCH